MRTRSRAVSIFNICAGMIATMAEIQKVGKVNSLLKLNEHVSFGNS